MSVMSQTAIVGALNLVAMKPPRSILVPSGCQMGGPSRNHSRFRPGAAETHAYSGMEAK